jgi:hypothetical protein
MLYTVNRNIHSSYLNVILEYLYYKYNEFACQVIIENMGEIFLIKSLNLLVTLIRVVAYVLHLFMS